MATKNRFRTSIESATNNTQYIPNKDVLSDTAKDISNINYNTFTNIKPNILHNILDDVTKKGGNNYSIYLSNEVNNALVLLSKKSKKSKSTLVNEILKEVLIN